MPRSRLVPDLEPWPYFTESHEYLKNTFEQQIVQLDGNTSNLSYSDNSKDSIVDDTFYDTEEEADSDPIPVSYTPIPYQAVSNGQPLKLDINLPKSTKASSLPLCLLMNCRSVCNKTNSLREMLHTIGPSITILTETWERKTQRLNNILKSKLFESVSCYRQNQSPGGGCAILFDKSKGGEVIVI